MSAGLWVRLMDRWPSLHPSQIRLTPEQGGLTYDEINGFIEALDEPSMTPRPMWECKPPI